MKFSEIGTSQCFRINGTQAVFCKIDDARCIQLRSAGQQALPAICLNQEFEVFLLN